MISCDDFYKFQEILLCTLILSIHSYDGNCVNSKVHSPAKIARLKLFELMSTEEHRAFKVIPDQESKEFQKSAKKLVASGLDPNDPQCFIHQQPDVDDNILQWLMNLKEKAEVDKNKKHQEANAYYMPKFFYHIFELAKEFPLWTSVNRKDFSSPYIRPTSCYVESAFGELKNNILNNVHGAIRCDKFFKIDFGASKSQCLIAAAEIAKIQMGTSLLDLDIEKTTSISVEIKNEENIAGNSSVHEGNELESFNENSIFLPNHHSTDLDVEIENLTNNQDEMVNKDLFAFENWRNKAVEEKRASDPEIIVTDIKKAKTLRQKVSIKREVHTAEKPSAVIIKEANIDKTIQQKLPKKRKIDIKQRKPSKFFRKCPNIMVTQNAAVAAAKISIKKLLLLHGNKFSQPIIHDRKKFMISNTCAFDSIVQIITSTAIDNPHYLKYLEESSNLTLGFALVFLEHGAVNHVYGLRCCILKDFQASSEKESNAILKLKETPGMLQTINCFCNVTEMWEFLMTSEPSLYLTTVYTCGHCYVEAIPSIFINHRIIEQEGFQNLQNAIITHIERNPSMCQRDNCGFNISSRLTINAHVFIELDVRASNNISESLTCKMEDLPLQINLHGTVLRLAGVITHHGDHYMARCKRLNGRWELYNDSSTTVTFCDKKKQNHQQQQFTLRANNK